MGKSSLGVGAAFFATIFCFRPMSVHRVARRSASGGARTLNLPVKSRLLYRLSYQSRVRFSRRRTPAAMKLRPQAQAVGQTRQQVRLP